MLCLLHTTRLKFQFFIKNPLALKYMIFFSKNYTKFYLKQYFLNTQANHDPPITYETKDPFCLLVDKLCCPPKRVKSLTNDKKLVVCQT